MNSVISAFKTKKNSNAKNTSNEKQHNGSGSSTLMHTNSNNSNNKKKAVNAQENGYQYLRHIREIETATKLLSPVVVVDDLLESDKLSFRAAPPACVDVVDHAPVRLTPTIDASKSMAIPNEVPVCMAIPTTTTTTTATTTPHAADLNMNGAAKCVTDAMSPIKTINKINVIENGNCNSEYHNCSFDTQTAMVSMMQQQQPLTNEFGNSPTQQLSGDVDDDESENSTTACISSSSEHSNSTVVHSPTGTMTQVPQIPQMPDVSTVTPRPQSPTTTTIQQQDYILCQQQPSPAKSLTLSLSSNTSSLSSSSCSSASSTSSSTTKLSSISTSSLASASVTSSSSSLPSSFAQCASVQSNISNAISNGCDTTIAASTTSLSSSSPSVTPSPSISPLPQSPAMQPSQHNNNQLSDYVPAFLKSPPITLPIIMPNGNSNLVSVPPQHHTATQINSAANTPKHARFSKPRLGLSRFINHSMPSVHGRPNLSIPGAGNNMIAANINAGTPGGAANTPKRISTHQRNLSLDFRSMGILLPPVSQVTNTRINLTQHHRNRSLDSALQRIPEVEVSSPNAESENTFCTPSILGSTMCSKIVTTAASVTAALTTTTTPALTAATTTSTEPEAIGAVSATISAAAGFTTDSSESNILPCKVSKQTTKRAPTLTTNLNLIKQPRLTTPPQHQINSSVIVEPCSSARSRPKSTDTKTTEETASASEVRCTLNAVNITNNYQSNSNININAITNSNNNGITAVPNGGVVSSKKREDLTSLGSDDSGIICGSESDQISLNRIRHSHESLDSGEMDAEEECIDMLETTSMDEEYNLLQSDLCFYQSPETDCRTLRPARKNRHQKGQSSNGYLANSTDNGSTSDISKETSEDLTERIRYRDMNMSQAAINMERSQVCVTPTLPSSCSSALELSTTATSIVASADLSTTAPTTAVTTPTSANNIAITPQPTIGKAQNDVLFKNFFGATKNAIFRTAQSIIENHEKKNAAKSQKSEDQSSTTDQIKSPTDISKKKEFFSLITSHSSKKASASAAAAAASVVQGSSSVDAAMPDLKSSTVSDKFIVESIEKHINLLLPLPNTSSSSGSSCNANISNSSNVSNTTSNLSKSASISSLNKLKVPGVVKCFVKERSNAGDSTQQKTEKGPSGLLRFFESPVFNIHFAVHYLFYSKEPGVLSFIGNKIFSFPDQEVDLYIPQLIVMYIQMDELAEVLDPYLTIRCRKSVDFSLKCLWLLEAYNYQVDSLGNNNTGRKTNLALMKELFSKKERKILGKYEEKDTALASGATLGIGISPMIKKTHHRSQSDATVLLADSRASSGLSISNRSYQQPPYTTQTLPTTPAKLCLGDLTSGRAFDNGCTCFETVRGQVNGLLGQKTVCSCGAPKTAPQKEFMKALINVGKNLTSLPSKAEKTSALRMFLNLINKNLPARVWLPLYSDIPHHVVRITEEKTAVLNSKDKTPYIIYVEVVEVPDIYSSPLIQKMMPSLRHTKSEEHLEGVCLEQMHHVSCSRTSSCSSRGTSAGGNGSSCRRKKEKLLSESSSAASEQHATTGGGDASSPHATCHNIGLALAGLHLTEDDVWSQEDDEITAQYLNLRKVSERDALSQLSLDSCDSRDQGIPVLFNIGDVRTRHCNNLSCENTKSFSNDPEDPSAAALKEPWHEKEKQIRESSPYGHLTTWRLLSAIVKCGDDLRQELMATQLLQMFKIIWQEENVDLWVRPYKIVCLSNDSGLIEPILNTVSLHQIKKNSNKSLRDYFIDEYGPPDGATFRTAQKNFVQSCSAYCLISYLLQVKDRHNGNILLHSDGHIIHIDFGFILSISPKNLGFEQSPFKLTHEFVEVMGGTQSEHWREFNRLLLIGMMSARKHMDRIINFVEIMRSNAQLPCFKNGCSGTVQNLRKRFHMNLTEQEMERKVEQLVQDSLKSLSTKLYDGYQYYTNGIL